ncbi:MAG: hypothetical protein LAO76_00625 [Acidobacteriia bacterium]|nr:hypothetical protein [Terriglobia bacterium]
MRKLALLLASLLIVANGCVISPRRTVGSTTGSGGSNSEFTLSANPTSQSVAAGGSTTFTITVQAVNGFTGTVSLSSSSSNSNVLASFDTTSITGGSGSAVLTVSTASGTPVGNITITVTASDTANNVSQNISLTASVQSAASPASQLMSAESAITPTGCVSTLAGSTAQRVSFPVSLAKGFTATFSVTPSSSAMDAALGFFGSSSGQPRLSSLINFSPDGIIQVRNGDSLTSSAVPYSAGETLQFRLVANLPATTYSLFVTPPGAAEVPLATDLQVPSGQRGATTLGGWGLLVNAPDGATLAVCNFSLQ